MALTKIPASLLDKSSNIDFADDEQLRFGDSNDLKMFHNSSGPYNILQSFTSNEFRIEANGNIKLMTNNGDDMVVCNKNGAVEIYYDDSKKIETSSAGATVTGTLTVTGDLDITGDINSSSVNDLDVVDKTITLGKGQTEANSGGSGIIIDGSNASMLWDESNGEFDFNNPLAINNSIGGDTVLNLTGSYGSGNSVALLGFARSGGAVSGDIKYVDATTDMEMGTGTAHAFSLKTSGSRRLTIESGGKIGMGTSSPSNYHAKGSNLVVATPGVGDTGMTIVSSSSLTGRIFFADGTSGGAESMGQIKYDHGSNFMSLHTSDNERLRIDSSGDVGIGTTSPTAQLDVRGATGGGTLTHALFTGTTGRGFEIRTRSDVSGGQHSGCAELNSKDSEGTGGDIAFSSNGNVKMFIDGGGNVGIGTSSPSSRLQVSVAGDPEVRLTNTSTSQTLRLDHNSIRSSTAHSIHLLANDLGNRKLTIATSSSNDTRNLIGIGTSSPGAALHMACSGSHNNVNDAHFYLSKNSGADWSMYLAAGNDDYGYRTDGNGSYALAIYNQPSSAYRARINYNGELYLNGGSSALFNINSDERLKEEISDAPSQWDLIKGLPLQRFKWIDRREGEKWSYGFIAQEVEKTNPEFVEIVPQDKEDFDNGREDPEYKTVAEGQIHERALAALQEAMARIETLEARVAELEG